MRNLHDLDSSRRTGPEIIKYFGSIGDAYNGTFILPSPDDHRVLRVIASSDDDWDHVSVSRPDRTPTWTEMDFIKRKFFLDHEVAIQFHVPTKDHINVHPNCLHLWRPRKTTIPLPPKEYV